MYSTSEKKPHKSIGKSLTTPGNDKFKSVYSGGHFTNQEMYEADPAVKRCSTRLAARRARSIVTSPVALARAAWGAARYRACCKVKTARPLIPTTDVRAGRPARGLAEAHETPGRSGISHAHRRQAEACVVARKKPFAERQTREDAAEVFKNPIFDLPGVELCPPPDHPPHKKHAEVITPVPQKGALSGNGVFAEGIELHGGPQGGPWFCMTRVLVKGGTFGPGDECTQRGEDGTRLSTANHRSRRRREGPRPPLLGALRGSPAPP